MPRQTYSIDLPSPKLFDELASVGSSELDRDASLDDLDDLDPAFTFPSPRSFPSPQSRRTTTTIHGRSISLSSALAVGPTEPTFSALPHKNQLLILALAVVAEFTHIAALQTVMFRQLQWFEPSSSLGKICWQAGILQGAFGAAQTISSTVWRSAADSPRVGRKRVLLVSFVATFISSLGLAFAGSFGVALGWRIFAGLMNGTTAAVRKMVVETVESKFQSRALMMLPVASYAAYIVGPLGSGFLADLFHTWPWLFGKSSILGGKKGVRWLEQHPFAPPHLFSALVLLVVGALVYLGLVETLAARRYFPDPGLELAAMIKRRLPRMSRRKRTHYTRLSVNDALIFEAPSSPVEESPTSNGVGPSPGHKRNVSRNMILQGVKQKRQQRQQHRDPAWTANALFTLAATGILHFHIGAFSTLWPVSLSLSTLKKSKFSFSSTKPVQVGLSFSPMSIGLALALVGLIGIILQLVLHPRTYRRAGKPESFSYALVLFPIAYSLMPYLATIPKGSTFEVWLCISALMLLHVVGQSFALPAGLVSNDSSPHATVICSVRGAGQSISTPSAAIGSSIAGALVAMQMQSQAVGAAWWSIAGVSALGCIPLIWLRSESDEPTYQEIGYSH